MIGHAVGWHRGSVGLSRAGDGEQPQVSVVFTCTSCTHTYEPTVGDFAAGRTECPDPDCGGWAFWAQLLSPDVDRVTAAPVRPDGGCLR